MQLFFQQVVNGIMSGSTYAIVALGLTMVYGIMHVPNFAHGNLFMLGAYMTFFMLSAYKVGFWTALLVSVLVLALLGVVVERIVFRPLRDQSPINSFIAAIGALLFIEHMVAVIWGHGSYSITNPYPQMLILFGVRISMQRLIVIIAALVFIIALQLFIKKTIVGTTIEAMAQEREGAALVGINVNRVSALTFAISTGLAAAAASLWSPIFEITPHMGSLLITKAMVIIILGGMGSIQGAIIGGYILGLVESLGGGYISSAYKDVFAFGLLIVVLAIKPTGLFGKGEH
ncbi:MAG: branched-chain amino acid ABC transporter permease [Dethiobacter sp.]|jgi:branched-chain amino acid transport system permease protein|nr:branched-chain amino acid ABC transporter permease [Dethiobacter sp.]